MTGTAPDKVHQNKSSLSVSLQERTEPCSVLLAVFSFPAGSHSGHNNNTMQLPYSAMYAGLFFLLYGAAAQITYKNINQCINQNTNENLCKNIKHFNTARRTSGTTSQSATLRSAMAHIAIINGAINIWRNTRNMRWCDGRTSQLQHLR